MKNWIVIVVRSIGVFFISFAFIRMMGKRQIARMTPFQFVHYTVVAVLAALISVNFITNLAFGFIALFTWVLLPIVFDFLSLKSKYFHDLINGKETVLIKHGKVMEENLSELRFTGEELLRELRSKNAFNLADVEFAVMESTGEMNILLKSDKLPVTAYDLGKKVALQSEPQTVILDGNILDEPLRNMGLNQRWLKTQLKGLGVSLDNVFIGQVDYNGDLYIDLFDDAIQISQPKVKELLYANLQKCQSDLRTFSLETNNQDANTMYSNNANKLQDIMKKLESYLSH
ncbi:DUF421 domain-containing protein [Marinisporobacter balticus]|uniref:Uncharacterized membrane protein YcaP (DUF421 family) n=1 Tax=Marinisporobacter balticus TaxID=2018667 RepID=A0A4R2KNC4_9FIRM|nr:DUF421 domain-containing protein [Marinisporobacter balticus]TCO72306.1 uncharacterized membrane protein YcaP (DUF421 family) [Marinisporobacter balticus]